MLFSSKTQKQEVAIETLQTELDQTNDELDKLNTTHLEERAQLIHDLQSCEREIDNLKDVLLDKEKEISTLSTNMVEYTDQISALKQEVRLKEEDLARSEKALSKAERNAQIIRDSQDSDQQTLNVKMTELLEELKDTETEMIKAKEDKECKVAEVEELIKQVAENRKTIQGLKEDLQKQTVSHNSQVTECETHISSLKEQIALSACKLQGESEAILLQLKDKDSCNEKLQLQLLDKDQVFDQELKSIKEERNNLLADVAKHNNDMQTLSKRLGEQLEGREHLEKLTKENVETITILGDQLKSSQEQAEIEKHKFNTELQARESENKRLGKELENKSENLSKLKNLLKNAKTEKQQLQDKLKRINEDLDLQKQNVEQLGEKLKSALQLNSNLEDQVNSLTDEKERLKMQVKETTKSVSELEMDLQVKMSDFEKQNCENTKIIQVLQRDKEELSIQACELNRVLEQSSQSISESLLEKANECNHLNQLLRTKEDEVTLLKGNVQSVTSQVEELQDGMKEKEHTMADLRMEITAQQNQQSELQEALSLRQEQQLSLKSDLIEKDVLLTQKEEECTIFQNEIVKKTAVALKQQAEVESLQVECSKLHQQITDKDHMLKEITQECEKYKDNLVKRDKNLTTLTKQLAMFEENATKLESEKAATKTSLDNINSENIGLRKELEQRQAEMSGFHGHIHALTEQNHQLRAACEIREKELAQQMQVACELDERMRGALEQNSNLSLKVINLTEESQKLQEDLAQSIQSFYELGSQKNLLQEKILGLQMQHSENRKIIEGLLKNKDDFAFATAELNNVLEQNKLTHAESLLLKTTECKNLSDTLREKKEQAAALKEQLDRLTTQANQLNISMTEKETSLSVQFANMEAQNVLIVQLQETVSLLQEQGSALKLGLMEKETMYQQKAEECSALQKKVVLQKDIETKMQGEAALLREECLDLHRQMGEKEQFLRNVSNDFENHKDELNKQNKLVASLNNQLRVMNEESGTMDIKIHSLTSTVETLSAENQQLVHEVNQRKTEVDNFRNNIQALDNQNAQLKSDLHRTLTEQSNLLENLSNLKMLVSDMETQVSNLTEELKTACSIKESLYLTLQEKEDSLKHLGLFLQQLQEKSVETEGQTSQKSLVITQLQTQIQSLQQCVENKEAVLQKNEKDLCFIQTEFTGEKTKLQNVIDLNVETIARLKGELSDAVRNNTELCSRIADQEIQVKLTVDHNHSLGSQVSEFEDNIVNLRNQVDTLTSESCVLKATLKENENIILELQRTSLAANGKWLAKETEYESQKEQLSHIQESVAKLNSSLQAQMSEIQSLKETIQEKESLLLVQIKSLEELQTQAEEITLVRAQFMQSTELVSQLQNQVQLLSTESANFSKSDEEKQSAFSSLHMEYGNLSEELKNARNQLTIRSDDVASLSKSVDDKNTALQAAEGAVEILRKELSTTKEELQRTLELNSSLSKQNEDAFSSYQTNTSSLTMEMENLKSRHAQVEVHMNLLTENLEQREMTLHAINSQYTGQAKQTAHLLSEMQKLEEQNKRLHEEISSLREEHQINLNSISDEKIRLQEEINTFVAEKEMLERRLIEHTWSTQQELQQQTSSMNETIEKAMFEREKLQAEVSVKVEEICELKSNIHKIEQILQDSEKEWLLVLDRESKDKNELLVQLKSVENEINSKDCKVSALKQDLNNLHKKLSDAASAIQVGSEQLKAKELEASTSRVQLEKILASVEEKENENKHLQQVLQDVESELQKLKTSKVDADRDLSVLSQTMSESLAASAKDKLSLEVKLKELQEHHLSELESLKGQLDRALVQMETAQYNLEEREKSHNDANEQINGLQVEVSHLQAQLHNVCEKEKEAIANMSSLHLELQEKAEQIDGKNIQITQQNELLAGLCQQLKDKDISIAQVIESASNERMELADENGSLHIQLQVMQQEHRSLVKNLEDKLQQLEEHTLLSQEDIESKISENGELIQENKHLKAENGKLSKDKDAIKKKLQAALLLRKDLMKRLEQYEKPTEGNGNTDNEVSVLQERLQEITSQAHVTTRQYEENILLLENKILQKENDISRLEKEKNTLVEHFEANKQTLQAALNDKEDCLAETLQRLNENTSLLTGLQTSISEKELATQDDRHDLQQKIQDLQNDISRSEALLKEKSGSALVLENELAQVKQENAVLQKKAQAALLARKETLKRSQENEKKLVQEQSKLMDEFNALLEQHGQQTNDLNDLQVKFEILRQVIEERDTTIVDLKMTLVENDNKGHSISNLHSELETLRSNLETMSSEMTSKNESLIAFEQSSQELIFKLKRVENDLEESHIKIKGQKEELVKYQQALQVTESMNQQDKCKLIEDNQALQSQLVISQAAVEEMQQSSNAITSEHRILLEERNVFLEQISQLKANLQTAVESVSQKSLEIHNIQSTSEETQLKLDEEKDVLAKELEKAQLYRTKNESSKLDIELLEQGKENAFRCVETLQDEVALLNSQLSEAKELNKQLNQNVKHEDDFQQDVICEEKVQSLHTFSEKLKERDDALFISQSAVAEKEELIASLEHQLQRQIHLHEMAMEKMRTHVDQLQKSEQDFSKYVDQENLSKTALLTRKLQAALVSRKDLMKQNVTLKDQLETMKVKCDRKVDETLALESTVCNLKQQNVDIENVASSLGTEKDKLIAEVDRILNDNHNLSAACESLKRTIENITQQKQAFSCQLESLKDSQTEELSEWKSKHSELKLDYESLLQAYENESSEMDKMRLLLEGGKREKQEALVKLHQLESEREGLEMQARDVEEENVRIKEKMRKFAKAKQNMIDQLEKENQNIKKELVEYDQKRDVKNQQLEEEISSLQESAKFRKEELTDIQSDNVKMLEELKEANCLLEKFQFDSKSYENMQFKLDEALTLNNSLTVQIQTQNTELGAQQQINDLLQKEKQSLLSRIESIENEHELHLGDKDKIIKKLQDIHNEHRQEMISLHEKVRILEDDKSLLQEELENIQEISDKVKNENEYFETVHLKNSERIDELKESINVLQNQNMQLSSQLGVSKKTVTQICQEKEQQQLRLVKEFEEKLKTAQRGSKGSKNIKRELQELLKEKHQEVNQLQQNCISYQEQFLDLEKSLKASQSRCEQLEKELKNSSQKNLHLKDRSQKLEEVLMIHKSLLQKANESIVSIQSEKEQLVLKTTEKSKKSEHQVTEENGQQNMYIEQDAVFQQRIDELHSLKEKETKMLIDLGKQMDSKDLEIATLRRDADTNMSKLAAMSSDPHGADASKQWNSIFQKALHEKDSQLLEQGFVIKQFLEDMRTKDGESNELRMTKSKLERALNEYSVAAAAHQRQIFVLGISNTELNETVETMNMHSGKLKAQVERLEQDKSKLNRELADKEDVASQRLLGIQQLEKMFSDMEAQLYKFQSKKDKFQADFEKQETISLQLKTLLQNKDAEISSLLSCRDGQISGYLEQLQTNHRAQIAGYEDRVTSLYSERDRADKEMRRLENTVRGLQLKVDRLTQEKEKMAEKMDSFRNSMISLQSERERLISEYRMLEEKNQLVLRDRDAGGDLSATKGMKHEIRKLLHQMDDLNSENAMLRAQLVRYREDLNQVLSLKDNQLKELLKRQQDVIKNLEIQKAVVEKQHRDSTLELKNEQEINNTLAAEASNLKTQVSNLEVEILGMKKERAETNEGKVICDLQQVVAAKASECNDLQQKLSAQKLLAEELKNKLQQLESETDKKLAEAEDKYNSELDTFEREVQLMRNERETADQRVQELASDLLQTEQLLSESKSQSKDLTAKNESLGKAIAALQNDRDVLIEDFKTLQKRYDEELKETRSSLTKAEHELQDATSELAAFAKEKYILVHKMNALSSQNTQSELNTLVDELSKALSEKESELKRVSLENNTFSKQVSAFSKSMASLQNDRERLMGELVGAKRVVESRQGSVSGAVISHGPEEPSRSCIESFQNERDGLVSCRL